MDRGDVLAFESDDEKYKDWKYFRVINARTVENYVAEGDDNKKVGAKMYLEGNVYTKKKTVLKAQKLFIGDFFKMTTEGKSNLAGEADIALIFLTNRDF